MAARALVVALLIGVPSVSAATRCGFEDPREVCRRRDILFMPGGHAIAFAPHAKGADPFVGGGVSIAPTIWSHNTEDFGPSQGSVYFAASLLRSESSPNSMALFEGGTTLSFERNSSRYFAIPYFGFAFGATLHEGLPDAGYVYTLGGLHLYWHENFMADLQGGYHFPFHEVDTLRGPRAQIVVRFSMW
jgi:hypothetical protein